MNYKLPCKKFEMYTSLIIYAFDSSVSQQQQQHSLFPQASWLEMKPERKKFKVQAH